MRCLYDNGISSNLSRPKNEASQMEKDSNRGETKEPQLKPGKAREVTGARYEPGGQAPAADMLYLVFKK